MQLLVNVSRLHVVIHNMGIKSNVMFACVFIGKGGGRVIYHVITPNPGDFQILFVMT